MIRSWLSDILRREKFKVGGTDTTLRDRAALAAFPIMFERAAPSSISPGNWHGVAAANAWAAADAFIKIRPRA